ncbi:MAG TPA: transporter [Polyangiales bacterium]
MRDFEAIAYAPNNTVVALGYFREVSSITGNLSESLAVFRATYIMKFGQLAIIPVDISLPIVDVTAYKPATVVSPMLPGYLNLAIHGSGVGDVEYFPTIAYTIAEGADGSSHTVLAFNPRISLATGNYDEGKIINTGANRVTFKPQIGIGQRFLKSMTAELVANIGIHSTNNNFVFPNPMTGALANTPAKQDPDLIIDAHLGMDLSRTFFLGASYYYDKAGAVKFTAMNNFVATEAQTVQSLRFSFGIRIDQNTLALLQFNQDISASNGASIERWFGVRLSHVFFEQPEPSVPKPRRETPEPVPHVNPKPDDAD